MQLSDSSTITLPENTVKVLLPTTQNKPLTAPHKEEKEIEIRDDIPDFVSMANGRAQVGNPEDQRKSTQSDQVMDEMKSLLR